MAAMFVIALGGCGPSALDVLNTQSILPPLGLGERAAQSTRRMGDETLLQAAAYGGHLSAYGATRPPKGFRGLCDGQGWACGDGAGGQLTSEQSIIQAASRVNDQVNRSVRSVSDMETVGLVEFWSLPVNGAGDCEDYALLKKKMLQEMGVPAHRLALATALNRQSEAHAVLILRLASGDLVLDNLTSRIVDWKSTGYTFLKLQRFDDQRRWDLVLAGPRAART